MAEVVFAVLGGGYVGPFEFAAAAAGGGVLVGIWIREGGGGGGVPGAFFADACYEVHVWKFGWWVEERVEKFEGMI